MIDQQMKEKLIDHNNYVSHAKAQIKVRREYMIQLLTDDFGIEQKKAKEMDIESFISGLLAAENL